MKFKAQLHLKWGALVVLAMMLLSIYPHLHFQISRGRNWNGSYLAIEGVGDEVAYSAYVNALVDGRPRRNDPYSGRDYSQQSPQSESLFSIQFVPAYTIAYAARAIGISTTSAFIFLTPVAAGASALVLFCFLQIVTGDHRTAAGGTIIVLCLGTVVGGHGLFAGFFGVQPLYNYFMFLRRYQPAASFPFFLLFFAVSWLAVVGATKRMRMGACIAAVVVFGLLVFSYVYLWTAAAAWLGILLVLYVSVRPNGWQRSVKHLTTIAVLSVAWLVPFARLLNQRAASIDAVQALELTHRPDLLRLPEIIGALVLIMLVWLKRQSVTSSGSYLLFAASFALLPFVVFNQQVVTGRSLQPLHYEMFVANYSALLAVVMLLSIMVKERQPAPLLQRKVVLWLAIAAFEWASYESVIATQRSMEFATRLDDARAVALRVEALQQQGQVAGTILSSDLLTADGLPTNASSPVLWAPHMLVFSGTSSLENKERFFKYLYYTGVSPDQLRNILRYEGRYGFTAGLFGFERTIKGLSVDPKPITAAEVEQELRLYSRYCESFSVTQAEEIPLAYLVSRVNEPDEFSNLDRWYQRDAGERVGEFKLYRLRLRDNYAGLNKSKGEMAR